MCSTTRLQSARRQLDLGLTIAEMGLMFTGGHVCVKALRLWFLAIISHSESGMSASEFMDALVQRETACLRAFDTFNYIYFSGPGGYCPTHESKLAVLRDFEKIAQYVLPERESL